MAARILLVEDDEVIRETTRVVLEDEGTAPSPSSWSLSSRRPLTR